MGMGRPNLYINGALVPSSKTAPAYVAVPPLNLTYGTDSRVDFAGPATLTGSVLIKPGAAMPAWSVGTQVGLVDPLTGRCLFAGHISNLDAAIEPAIAGAGTLRFTATSPLADLINYTVYGVDWAGNDADANLRGTQLRDTLPRGWLLDGNGKLPFYGIPSLKYASANWLELLDRYCRGQLTRRHDTSAFVPGSGFVKRLTLTSERAKTGPNPPGHDHPGGTWFTGTSYAPAGASGLAVIPAGIISRDLEWEKNPDDTITDVKLTTHQGSSDGGAGDAQGWDLWMEAYGVDNRALQDRYGYRQLSLDTDQRGDMAVGTTQIPVIVDHWLDADTQWRPTAIEIADPDALAANVLVNLLAVDTRHMAAMHIPGAVGFKPARIYAFVTRGKATWTGTKWNATFTLGRTFD